jgi:hypothetical protein
MYLQYLDVRPSKIGQGIFTKTTIPAGVPITEFKGQIYPTTKLPVDSSMFLQIGPASFLGPIGTVNGVDYINHSCDPNCTIHVIGNRAILYSLYVIPANSELNFDYSTTSTDSLDTWKMDCLCGSPKCRRVISGFQYLNPALQEDYKKRGMVPLFISEPRLIQVRQG